MKDHILVDIVLKLLKIPAQGWDMNASCMRWQMFINRSWVWINIMIIFRFGLTLRISLLAVFVAKLVVRLKIFKSTFWLTLMKGLIHVGTVPKHLKIQATESNMKGMYMKVYLMPERRTRIHYFCNKHFKHLWFDRQYKLYNEPLDFIAAEL